MYVRITKALTTTADCADSIYGHRTVASGKKLWHLCMIATIAYGGKPVYRIALYGI